jgi:hypothetical protein
LPHRGRPALHELRHLDHAVGGGGSGCVFLQIWRQVLKPKISEVLSSIGRTGVPLPFIRGFLFVDDVVTLQPSDARIDTNIKYV